MTHQEMANRLVAETGSYYELLADDPIAWQPWDDSALAAARKADLPIFLSIGHPLDPWCRRMHAESFHDESIAARLNESFVPIAVDRESRRDIDEVYQMICRTVEEAGGWPLSAWLTPDCQPFYIGTYFPQEHTDYAPGFPAVIDLIAEKWASGPVRTEIEERGSEWVGYAAADLDTPAKIDEWDDPLDRVARLASRTADPEHGGWGVGAKSPEPTRLNLLLVASELRGNNRYRSIATATLDAVVDGEIRDHVGGGFFEYSREQNWTAPLVEKSLTMNIEVARVLLRAAQLTGSQQYREAAEQTLRFLERDLISPTGCYIAGVGPGTHATNWTGDKWDEYYRWTIEEVKRALGDEALTEIVKARYGLGNHGDGKIPRIEGSIAEVASGRSESPSTIEARLETARETLRENRSECCSRPTDDRVIVAKNGQAIRMLSEAAIALSDESLAERATTVCEGIREHFWEEGETELSARSMVDGELRAGQHVFLDDYVFLGHGALACFELTGETTYLRFATDLAHAFIRDFWDGERLCLVPIESGDQTIINPQVSQDRTAPSSIAGAITLLATLDRLVPTPAFSEVSRAVTTRYASRISTDLLAHHSLATAVDLFKTGPTEVIFLYDTIPQRWRQWLADRYIPHRVIVRNQLEEFAELDLGAPRSIPLSIEDEQEGVFLRRGETASTILNDPNEADRWLDANAQKC